uniref:Exopolygalacturonase n=1 Tax=Leersia perrieri TaxID=77586 RepID=A0A0D9XQW0_9ORYZ
MVVAVLALFATAAMAAVYNVVDYGARAGGGVDSAGAFLAAWAAACGDDGGGDRTPPVMRVPAGNFLVGQAYFRGPCRSAGGVVVAIDDGAVIVAPPAVANTSWIMFHYAHRLAIRGGTLDGNGHSFWSCKSSTKTPHCPPGTTTLDISQSNNVSIKRLTLLNSKNVHVSIFDCTNVTLRGVRITAPADSPNTDGIRVALSRGVTILAATVRTGDDCVTIGPGTAGVVVRGIRCGPGHGISIGSLGGGAGEGEVRDVTVEDASLADTQNGVRIKTWAKPFAGRVSDVRFARVAMHGVENPIVIDQNYCPGNINCPNQMSGVKISDVVYEDITGTSATAVAVRLDCSGSNPCTGITLRNINLTYDDGGGEEVARSFCRNAAGSASGVVSPPSCL